MRLLKSCGVAFAAGMTLVVALGATAATAAPVPCKPGQATKGCTRAWVSAGCNQFKPLVKSTLGIAPTSATRYKTPSGLSCGFKVPGLDDFGFIFAPSGATATIFASIEAAQQAHIVGCQAAANPFDSSTQTPAATPKRLPGVGDQAFVYFPCPGGFIAYENNGDQQVITNIPSAYVRRGSTAYSAAAGLSAAQLSAFMKLLVATYR
jgi:hypothetical protein